MKKQVATWIVVGMLAVGAGIAVAEGGAPDPELQPADATTTTLGTDDLTTTTVGDTTTTEVETEADKPETEDAEADGPEASGDHGARVSEAAHDHDFDEACGNHGAYVSAIAHGEETCEDAALTPTVTSSTERGHGKSGKHDED